MVEHSTDNRATQDRYLYRLPYKNIFDGEGAALKGGNYFGPLVGANGLVYQR